MDALKHQQNSPLSAFFLYAVLLMVAIVSLVPFQMDELANDPGLGWHLSGGALILHQHKIPQIDPFLFSLSPRAWVYDQWLADVLFSSLFQFGSWPLCYAFACFLFLFTFMGILKWGLRIFSLSSAACALAALWALRLSSIHFILRPVFLSFPLFALVYLCCLSIYYSKNESKVDLQFFVLLPCLFALWANIHPSFFLGFAVVGLLILSLVAERFLNPDAVHSSSFTNQCIILLFLCVAATILNPSGIHLHQSILTLLHSDYVSTLYAEWQSIDFKLPEGRWFEITLVVSVIGAGAMAQKSSAPRGNHTFIFLLTLFLAHQAATSVRFLPYFGICSAPLVARALDDVLLSKIKPLRNVISGQGNVRIEFVTLVTLSILFFWFALARQSVPFYSGTFGPTESRYPYNALRILEQNAENKTPNPILNDPNWGGFLTYNATQKLKALIDDRTSLLGEQFYQDFFTNTKSGSDWYSYAKKLGAKYILLPSAHQLRCTLEHSPHAKILYSDNLAFVAEIID